MILAAGRGARMRPLTDHTPKPLLNVGNKPLIVWHIEKLKTAGFNSIVINTAWLGDQISKVLGDGSQFGVTIAYSNEQAEGALETAGGIIKALPILCDDDSDEPFFVVNGDVWSDFSYSMSSPLQSNDLVHLIMVNNPEHNPKGDFALINSRLNDKAEEKLTYSGMGYYHPELFKGLKEGKQPLAPILKKAMQKGKISGEYHQGDWQDVGTPERLKALDELLLNKIKQI